MAFSPFIHAQEDLVDMKLRIYRWAFSNAMKIPDLETGRVTSTSQNSEAAELWFKNGDEWRRLTIAAGEKSKEFSYKGARRLSFCSRNIDNDGNPVYREITNVVLPSGASESFLLMFMNGKIPRFYPMNVSPTSLPKDKLAIMNMTIHPVGITVGGDSKVLKSGAFIIFSPKKKDADSLEVKLSKYDKNMKKWREVYDNSMSISNEKRSIMLIYDPYNSKSPKFTIQLLSL